VRLPPKDQRTRRSAKRFLKRATKTKTSATGLAIVPHCRGTSPRLTKTGQDRALQKGGLTNELEIRDRAAVILILVFGQQVEIIARLTWDDVAVTDDRVITLAAN